MLRRAGALHNGVRLNGKEQRIIHAWDEVLQYPYALGAREVANVDNGVKEEPVTDEDVIALSREAAHEKAEAHQVNGECHFAQKHRQPRRTRPGQSGVGVLLSWRSAASGMTGGSTGGWFEESLRNRKRHSVEVVHLLAALLVVVNQSLRLRTLAAAIHSGNGNNLHKVISYIMIPFYHDFAQEF